jgi:acyl-CoA synthetase (NDP forming)
MGAWLEPSATASVLVAAGIPYVRSRLVRTLDELTDATTELGYPLVAKTGDPSIVHKTDQHLVHTGIRNLGEARIAAASILEVQQPGSAVLLQHQESGPELAIGVVSDASFGPLVMVASGGVTLDLWGDQTFLMPPLTPTGVRDALSSLRIWPLLNGFRGSRPLDVDAVVAVVCAIGEFALARPDISELDLNPVMVTEAGPVCVDARIRVRG